MATIPYMTEAHARAPIHKGPHGWLVQHPWIPSNYASFLSEADAKRHSAAAGAGAEWCEARENDGTFTLTEAQRCVIIGMFVSHKVNNADAAGVYAGKPVVKIYNDMRALDDKGFDILHINNRQLVSLSWHK